MKKFLKLVIVPAAILICSSQLVSCNANPKEIALITDVGDIDDGSFNQASWEGIKGYCDTNHKTYDYYRPFADSDFARRCSIKQAVYKGAKVIICPGFKFANAVDQAQVDYPDVKFLLMDSVTSKNGVKSNTVCVGYRCDISGYLAGYAIACDYMRYDLENEKKLRSDYNFGYCGGMANDGVLNFGFGMIQGVVNAVEYMYNSNKTAFPNIEWPNINVRFNYAGVFAQSDDAATKMKSWYAADYKCIFACGGKLYQSIVEGVKDYNRKNNYYDEINKLDPEKGETAKRDSARWIGVDSDQYGGLNGEANKHAKNTIYTSALKGLGPTIQTTLDYYYGVNGKKWSDLGGSAKDHFKDLPVEQQEQTGDQWVLGLNSKFGFNNSDAKDYVGIPESYNKDTGIMRGFKNFKYESYKKLTEEIGKNPDYVYSKDGTDVIKDDGTVPAKGDPTFMSKSTEYFVDADKTKTFYNAYYELDSGVSIPADKINCKLE